MADYRVLSWEYGNIIPLEKIQQQADNTEFLKEEGQNVRIIICGNISTRDQGSLNYYGTSIYINDGTNDILIDHLLPTNMTITPHAVAKIIKNYDISNLSEGLHTISFKLTSPIQNGTTHIFRFVKTKAMNYLTFTLAPWQRNTTGGGTHGSRAVTVFAHTNSTNWWPVS